MNSTGLVPRALGTVVISAVTALITLAATGFIPMPAAGGVAAAGVTIISVVLLHQLRRYRWLAATLILGVVIILAIGGFWFSFDRWGISDWDYYFSLHENIRQTVLIHHQLPLWNPYTCGGTAALGDPEFSLFTPTFLLELLLGIPAGLRAAIYLATITGGVGMLLLGRRLGLSVYAALLVALAFSLGSVNLLEIVEGHPNIFAAGWVPWIFWSWLGAYRRPGERRYITCGIFLALTFYQGGIYLLMYTALAFLVLPFLVRDRRRAITVTMRAGVWALGFAALKLIPVLLWLRQFQDDVYASSTYTLPFLQHVLLGRYLHGADVLPNQGGGWHEYGAYLGPVIVVLALVGLLQGRWRRSARMLGIAAVLAIVISSTGPLLKPLFDQVSFLPRSNISRLILFGVIPLVLLAGKGFDALRRRSTGRWRPLVTTLLLGLAAIDLMTLSYALSLQAFVLPPVLPAPAPAKAPLAFTTATYKLRWQGDDYTRAYAATLAGYGTLSYCSVLTPPPRVRTIHDEVDNDYVSLSSKSATAVIQSWSPNRVTVVVSTAEPTTVVINTNFAYGWRVNGVPALEIAGRVGSRVDPGEHTLTFAYRAPGFILGTVITALVIILLSTRWLWRRYSHRSTPSLLSSR